ncbi:MAG TPA: hypothetical protein VN634_17880 [Candidatus Limnocylindrales bacterium]|nr:hypothetical protein [Candidatus Limnocylindrales bacterium]
MAPGISSAAVLLSASFAVAVISAMSAGCAVGPEARPDRAPPYEDSHRIAEPSRRESSRVEPSHARQARPAALDFRQTGAALDDEIDRRASDLASGPIGNRAAELASLRLVASARDLLDSGSPDGAREALERAVSLYGRNGYAYLWLAYVEHLQRRPHWENRAATLLADARRDLPSARKVRAELEELEHAIGAR